MPAPFAWSSPVGFELVRNILKNTSFPHTPHDYQLEGVCKSLDRVHLFAITPTGSGKTGYYGIYMLVILAVLAKPELCPSAKFPKNACLLVICPTIPLQLEMANSMRGFGLDALAINSDTRLDALRLRNEELWVTARTKPNVILTGPEQLSRSEFEKSLRDEKFFRRICGTGFDEVHLLNTWGASFRKDFQQMGFLKARMTDHHNPWILTSASVEAGDPFDSICRLLGLNNNYHLIRRSCLRPDVRILFRELVSPISGDSFPELHWIIEGNRPTVIYAKTISLGFRIYGDLLRKAKLTVETNRIRMYNSLNFESYNAQTREIMAKQPEDPDYCQIIVGTDALSVGVAMKGRVDAVEVGELQNSNDALQKMGRVNRDKTSTDARGLIYVSAAARKHAEKVLAEAAAGTMKLKPGASPPDLTFPKLIVAKCKTVAINDIYNNPTTDPRCSCPTCQDNSHPLAPSSCNCSGCIPENLPALPATARASKVNTKIPKSRRLSRLQKSHGTKRLLQLRTEFWRDSSQSPASWMLPPSYFLSDQLIAGLLDNFVLLKTVDEIKQHLRFPDHLLPCLPRILEVLVELNPQFTAIAAARKAENAANRAKGKLVEESEEEDDYEGDDGVDAPMADVNPPTLELRDVTMTEINVPPKAKATRGLPKPTRGKAKITRAPPTASTSRYVRL
ncbi:ATP-dependent DNA helicase Q1 [Favolaschia claudopus]|uniref:DNA 3'-5' helicase n=1 Tax=Favolaschia claudopus TaxID=2862362 RepID=A0AAW0ARI3_9AGAR